MSDCCDPRNCSLPGSSVYEISQARILEWVAISFSKGSFRLRDWTYVSCTSGRFFTAESLGKPELLQGKLNVSQLLWITLASWPLLDAWASGRSTDAWLLIRAEEVMLTIPAADLFHNSKNTGLSSKISNCHLLATCLSKSFNQKTHFSLSG